jgi:hypothetical protein
MKSSIVLVVVVEENLKLTNISISTSSRREAEANQCRNSTVCRGLQEEKRAMWHMQDEE